MNRKVLLSLNAESFFAPMWIQAYLDADYEIDIVSRYDIRRNLFYDRILSIIESRGKGRLKVRTCREGIIGGKIADYLKLSVEIPVHARARKYDALHVHYLGIRGVGALLSGMNKLILSPYGSDIFDEKAWGRLLPRFFSDLLIDRVVTKATLILPTSKYMEDYLINRFNVQPAKIFTKSWGIDLENWSKKSSRRNHADLVDIDDRATVFLSYRRARPTYRIHLLPKTHSLLEKAGMNSHFIYCFNSSVTDTYVSSIVEDVKRRGLEGKSHFFFDSLSDVDIRCLLDKSDYFFSIPRWDQLSSTLLEGLYRQVIPIIPPLPVYDELMKQGCMAIISEPTPDNLAEVILNGVKMGLHNDKEVLVRNKTVIETHHNRTKNLQEIMQEITSTLLA